jgi:hypothetical protein
LFVDLNAILFVTCLKKSSADKNFLQHVSGNTQKSWKAFLFGQKKHHCLFVCLQPYYGISRDLSHSNMQGIEGMMLADTFAKNSTEHQEISNPFRL